MQTRITGANTFQSKPLHFDDTKKMGLTARPNRHELKECLL